MSAAVGDIKDIRSICSVLHAEIFSRLTYLSIAASQQAENIIIFPYCARHLASLFPCSPFLKESVTGR